ncbi:MAG: lipopolysaccharide biosynthesis protein [Prolixibacteraceae bacterium]
MGIIIKQSIKGSIWSYFGIIIGFVTTSYLFPEYLSPELVGLFGILVAIATITSQLASLGINGVTGRLFPVFRSNENGHNGYVFLSLMVHLVGFVLFLIFYFLFKNYLVSSNIEKSPLLAQYIYLIVPATLFFMAFNFFDTYNKVLYDAVLGTFLQEFFQRMLIFVVVVLYAFKLISLPQLIVGYVIAISLKSIVLWVYLLRRGEINLRPNLDFITAKLKKEIIDVALFSVIGGLGSMIVFNIDKIVINQLLGLEDTGVYTIAFYFGTLVVIPSRPLLKIAGTLIADAFTTNDLGKINEIYYKSCLNQFIIGGFLFLGIWANIDNILYMLGPDYAQSKWVIFFIGIGYLFDMLTGANGLIIRLSEYYRVAFWIILILIGFVVAFLFAFIPIFGIVGAAMAIALALFLNNLMRYIFLVVKYKMQPFNYKFIIIAAFYVAVYLLVKLIPQQSMIVDLIIRGSVITLLTAIFVFFVPISDDFITIRNYLLKTLKKWF